MLKKALALIAIPLVLLGCASTQPIAQADKTAVKAVVVSREVPVPAKMYYLGPGGASAFAFGAIGAAAAAPGIEKDRAAFQEQAAGGKGIDAIVLEEVLVQVRKSGKFPLVESPATGAATLHTAVLSYGFSIPHGFSQRLVPVLDIRCELREPSGRVIWSATQRVLPLGNPVDSIPAEDVQKSPAIREAAWREAARALAIKIVETY